MNFAIYHKELTDMDEREEARERESERKRQADHDANDNEQVPRNRRRARSGQAEEAATEGYATSSLFFNTCITCLMLLDISVLEKIL